MKKKIQLGDRFGRLTIVSFSHSDNGAYWNCACDCGGACVRRTGDLNKAVKAGSVSSCGCATADRKTVGEGLYRCGKCKQHLPKDAFYPSKTLKHGITSYCRGCYKAYVDMNRDAVLQRKRDYHHRTKAIFADARREYRKSTKDAMLDRCKRWRENNPERRREVANSWVKRNSAYNAFRSSLRVAAKKRATPKWANLQAIALIYRKAHELRMEVDHVVPLNSDIVCGLHCEANLQVLIKDENLKKSNRYWPDMP